MLSERKGRSPLPSINYCLSVLGVNCSTIFARVSRRDIIFLREREEEEAEDMNKIADKVECGVKKKGVPSAVPATFVSA